MTDPRACYLVREEHVPEKAMFPAIDAHNHLWGRWDNVDQLVRVMNETGIVANFAENLGYVSNLLDRFPHIAIDFSARLDELGRRPYTAREFFIRHQDRIVFGTDMPGSVDMYRCYFRFLETGDEWFQPPDYDGTFDRARWHIAGLNLPPAVLRKVYRDNILSIVPGLKKDLGMDIEAEATGPA